MFDSTAWLAAYRQAWITRNAEQVAQLFTEDATYQSHPLRPPYRGRAEIRAYWQRVTSTQDNIEVRWGTPIVAGNRMAVEWWTTMHDSEEGDVTLPGCLLLRFSEDGLCEELREYWNLETGDRILPQTGWGT